LSLSFPAAHREDFRVVHFSVQTDHVHLIVEADAADNLRAGINGLAGRMARALNRVWRRGGAVWSDRYHSRALTTPREVRNAFVYVLLTFRKHLRAGPGIDPRSSGAWFDGWSNAPTAQTQPCPVASAQTWLATAGWRRAGGPIGTDEAPGPK
jgi:putative transposase